MKEVGQFEREDEARSLFRSGTEALESGDFESADAALNACLRLCPGRESVKVNLGVLYNRMAHERLNVGDFESALDLFSRSILFNDEDPNVWFDKGWVLSDGLSHWEEAISCFLRAIQLSPDSVSAHQNLGVTLSRCGRLDEALQYLDRAAELAPTDPTIWLNRGNVLNDLARYSDAIKCYEKATTLSPSFVIAWSLQGALCIKLGHLNEALRCFSSLVKLHPSDAGALSNLAMIQNLLGDFPGALAHLSVALELEPMLAAAWCNRGIALHGLCRHQEALFAFKRSIEIDPALLEAWLGQGITQHASERFKDALNSFDVCITLNPSSAQAWSNRGLTLGKLGNFKESLANCDKAIELDSKLPEVWCNRGSILRELKRFDEALADYHRGIDLAPNSCIAWFNKGVVLQDDDQQEDAIASYDRALEIDPQFVPAWFNRGVSLRRLARFRDSLSSFLKAEKLNDRFDFLLGEILHTQMQICDWHEITRRLETLKARVLDCSPVTPPFVTLGLFDLPEIHSKSAAVFFKKLFMPDGALAPPLTTSGRERIKVAYFSMDFREHPVSLLLVEVIEQHCRETFEVFGFSIGAPSSDPLALRLRAAFDRFHEVTLLSDPEIVAIARELNIDIAIDLAGHTQGARPGLFYQRMAPVQISYLGYPGTTQNPGIDYFLADRSVLIGETVSHFSERILFLDGQYLPSPSIRPNQPAPTVSAKYGIPEGAFCFACFNNGWKIVPEVFSAWMKILAAVERGILWLKPGNPVAQENLIRHAMSAGIDSSRILFAERTASYSEHLERYKAVDLFLDTFPYGAHTTASDALWMGTPILTLRGRSIPNRVCSSLLERLDVRELITESLAEYTSKAIELGSDGGMLPQIKCRILDNSKRSGLFDSAKYTLDIDQAYRSVLTEKHSRKML